MPDNPSAPLEYPIFDPERHEVRVVVIQPPKRRYWLHALLFLATVFTTLCIGARLQYNFNRNLPAFSAEASRWLDYWPWSWAIRDWFQLLRLGWPFSASLLGILTAHEFGHYVMCVRRRVFATLPFFIPAPTLIGTLGAFIRLKSPIRSRSDLFDIGVAGPIAGFIVAVPVLLVGLLCSKPFIPTTMQQSDVVLGLPLIFSIGHWMSGLMGSHSGVQGVYLHPVAFAAWFGMFATALNLLPGGQLDGGHIIFAVNPRWHRPISLLTILILVPLSLWCWAGWLLWAVVLRVTGGRHPDVPLTPGLDKKRLALAVFALLMLVLTVTPRPLPGSLMEWMQEWREQRHSPSQQR